MFGKPNAKRRAHRVAPLAGRLEGVEHEEDAARGAVAKRGQQGVDLVRQDRHQHQVVGRRASMAERTRTGARRPSVATIAPSRRKVSRRAPRASTATSCLRATDECEGASEPSRSITRMFMEAAYWAISFHGLIDGKTSSGSGKHVVGRPARPAGGPSLRQPARRQAVAGPVHSPPTDTPGRAGGGRRHAAGHPQPGRTELEPQPRAWSGWPRTWSTGWMPPGATSAPDRRRSRSRCRRAWRRSRRWR